MNTVRFECEVVTPMFMAGADQERAELRAPSIKGSLRWWFRAANANLGLNDLAKKEADVFGSTEKTSAVKVRISFDERYIENWIGNDIKTDEGLNFKPNEERRITGDDSGIAFLFYSTLLRKDKHGEVKQQRGYFKPGFRFILELSSSKKEALKSATEAFWLLSFLGGMGSRSRRGAGNVCIHRIEGVQHFAVTEPFLVGATNAEELKVILEKGIKMIRPGSTNASSFTSLAGVRVIILNKPFSRWKDALNEVGSKYEEYRFKRRSYPAVGASFGMPVMHDKGNVKLVPEDAEGERFASPLHFKVWKAGQFYFAGIVCLHSNLYSSNVKVVRKKRVRDGKWKIEGRPFTASKNDVEDFIKLFPDDQVLELSFGVL